MLIRINTDNDNDNDSDSTPSKVVRRDTVYTKHYPLGAKLAQCCGGSVTVMFECFNVTPPMSILVFGAGHVAAALMTILAELPCQVDWVDSRPEMFERYLLDKSNSLNKSIQTLSLSFIIFLPISVRMLTMILLISFARLLNHLNKAVSVLFWL